MLISTIVGTLAIFFDTSHRIADYIIFSLPRTIEGMWDLFEKLDIVKPIPLASQLIFALSIAVAVYLKKKEGDSEIMPKSYVRGLKYIFSDL
jgi:hypothetical protein